MTKRTAGLGAITLALALMFACGKDSKPAASKDKQAVDQGKPAAAKEDKPAAKKDLIVKYYAMPG